MTLEEPINDGLRRREDYRTSTLEDGCTQDIHESLEEVVPMRVVQRVTRKTKSVPIEEKVETFSLDGGVNTKIKSLPASHLDLNSTGGENRDIHQLLEMISALDEKISNHSVEFQPIPVEIQPTIVETKKKDDNSFYKQAEKKYGPAKSIEDAKPAQGKIAGILSVVGWLLLGTAAAILTYAVVYGIN